MANIGNDWKNFSSNLWHLIFIPKGEKMKKLFRVTIIVICYLVIGRLLTAEVGNYKYGILTAFLDFDVKLSNKVFQERSDLGEKLTDKTTDFHDKEEAEIRTALVVLWPILLVSGTFLLVVVLIALAIKLLIIVLWTSLIKPACLVIYSVLIYVCTGYKGG